MPDWQHRPPEAALSPALPIIRTPSHGTLTATITSHDLIGCPTHFFHGRTGPCTGPNCDACADGTGYRWKAYLGIMNPRTGSHSILELTALTTLPLIAFVARFTTLRGATIQLLRPSGKINGRILCTVSQGDTNGRPLPTPPDIKKILARVWNLPQSALDQHGNEDGINLLHANQDAIDQAQKHPSELPPQKRNGRLPRYDTTDAIANRQHNELLNALQSTEKTDGPNP